jgi:hypothetical protein
MSAAAATTPASSPSASSDATPSTGSNVAGGYEYNSVNNSWSLQELKEQMDTLELLHKKETNTSTHYIVVPPRKGDTCKGWLSLPFLLENVKTNQGLKYWAPTEKIAQPSVSLQTSISEEQYNVVGVMLVRRLATVMAKDPKKWFGEKTNYVDYEDMDLRIKKIESRYGGDAESMLPSWATPPVMKDDGSGVKWQAGLKTKSNLNAHTGAPEIAIFPAENIDKADYEHPIISMKKPDKLSEENWEKKKKEARDQVVAMSSPYDLVPKFSEYDLAALALGVQIKADLWSIAGRSGQIVVTKKGNEGGSNLNGKRSVNSAFANKYKSQTPRSESNNDTPASSSNDSSANEQPEKRLKTENNSSSTKKDDLADFTSP